MNIGFIGMGKMAEAILRGVKKAKLFDLNSAAFYDPLAQRSDYVQKTYGIKLLALDKLVSQSDILIFCVKPQNVIDLLANFPQNPLSKKLLISILAGTKMALFQQYLDKDIQILRVMPNTPALVGEGMSALAFGENVSSKFKEISQKIFSSLGQVELVEEKDMDVVTGISGSGPAFLYRLADDIAKTGQNEGFAYDKSLKLIAQTMVGAGKMLLESKKNPEELIKEVSSPNGTTVAGLQEMEKSHIDAEIKNVVLAAIKRSKELGAV